MTAKRLASGATAYYWAPPTRAKRSGCPVQKEPLGTDYAIAKRRCDDVLNPHYKAWLTNGEADLSAPRAPSGTWDWMVGVYKTSPKYTGKGVDTRDSYDRMLVLVSKYVLKDGRLFGTLALASITPGTADRLFEKLKVKPNGGTRVRTAVLAMRVCQRA